MDIKLVRREGSLTREDVVRYYYYRNRVTGEWTSEELEQVMNDATVGRSRPPVVIERVPRKAVKYMDTSRFYELTDRRNDHIDERDRVFEWCIIHEIRQIIYYGAYNAMISDEEIAVDPLSWVERGAQLVCEFALSKGYGIQIVE